MPDVQFHPIGTEAAPADWSVPSAVEIVPRCVRAVFDGSGAAGAFLPTLVVLSDSGREIGRFPTDTSVAAGASAEVSWFPGVRHTASAVAAGALAYAYAYFDANGVDPVESIPNNVFTSVTYQHFVTSDLTVFGTFNSLGLPLSGPPGHNTAGDNALGLYRPGLYLIHAATRWPSGSYFHRQFYRRGFSGGGALLDPHSDNSDTSPETGGTTSTGRLHDTGLFQVGTQGAMDVQVNQSSGVAIDLSGGWLGAYWFGSEDTSGGGGF